jgi:hypothetical protein
MGPDWLPDRTTVFNAQILNSAAYKAVTGEAPPLAPMDVATYAALGYPFYKMYEEPTGIHGEFSKVKSIAELDKTEESEKNPKVVSIVATPGLINPNGPLRQFRTARELMQEYSGYHVARF